MMTEATKDAPKRRPGRPSTGKRGNFTFRVREKIREQLIEAAQQSDVSVSEEIERRLEESFSAKGVVSELLGGPHIQVVMLMFSAAIRRVEIMTGATYPTDPITRHAANEAMQSILDGFKQPAPGLLPHMLADLRDPYTGELVDSTTIGRDAANTVRADVAAGFKPPKSKEPKK